MEARPWTSYACWFLLIDDKKTIDRSFYNIIGGHKNSTKKYLLDKCLVLVVHKWRKLSPPKKWVVSINPLRL